MANEYDEFVYPIEMEAVALNGVSEAEVRGQIWAQHESSIREAMASHEAKGWEPALNLGPEGVQLEYDDGGSFRNWDARQWVIYIVAGLLTGGILLVVLPFIWRHRSVIGASYRIGIRRTAPEPAAAATGTTAGSVVAQTAARMPLTDDPATPTSTAAPKTAATVKKATSKQQATTKKSAAKTPAAKKAAAKKKTPAKKQPTRKTTSR